MQIDIVYLFLITKVLSKWCKINKKKFIDSQLNNVIKIL